MTAALSGEQRSALEKLVQNARRAIEADLEQTLEGKFGINSDGQIESADRLSLTNTGHAVRADLVEVVEYLRAEGEGPAESVARLIREAAFTHTNRLIAVRVAEAIDLLPETMAFGIASKGFKDFSELAPTIATTEWGRFAEFIRLCADELAVDVPTLFDPRNPLLELAMSEGVLTQVVEAMALLEPDLWAAPDTLGWAYQFFNTDADRRAARYTADGSPKPPETSAELAVRNQFFTPGYVVDFLVQNGLGSHLASGSPALASELSLLVDLPGETRHIDLRSVTLIDPACGSGHFLLGAYDLLERAWEVAGVDPGEAAESILGSLWGIDIDPRAAQIAQAAVMFRARRHRRRGPLPRPNVICARALPGGEEVDLLIDALPEDVRRVVQGLAKDLALAPVLGPLLKIEERLSRELKDVFGTGVWEGTLADRSDDDGVLPKSEVLDALALVADAVTSSSAERLFAAEAIESVRFVEAMSQRYSFALTNPPFGQGCSSGDRYLKAGYPDCWTELYACFVERCLELAELGVGAITSSTFLTTKRLKSYRERLAERGLALVVDLGAGVLHGATVNTAMIVARRCGDTQYLDLRDENDNERSLRDAVEDDAFTDYDLRVFARLPNTPFAFHAPPTVVDMWESGTTLDPAVARVRTGGKTFDNFRYLRLWWELAPDAVARGWTWYEKGGEYQPYFAPTALMVNWKDDGGELRSYGEATGRLAQVLQSSTHWRQPGICYPRMSSIGFAARLMPAGEIFADTSIAVLPAAQSMTLGLLGFLNSTAAAELLGIFGRGRSTENDSVKSLPIAAAWIADAELINETSSLVLAFESLEATRETSPAFSASLGSLEPDNVAVIARSVEEHQETLDMRVADLLGLTERVDPTIPARPALNRAIVEDDSGSPVGDRVLSFLMGVVVGRWRQSESEDATSPGSDALAQRPSSPPVGALESAAGVLVDQIGHPLDVAARLEELRARLVPPTLEAPLLEVLGRRSLREHLRTRFFQAHLGRYSASGRKAPIYWQLQVPSKSWGLWLYAPKLSREMLFAIARETEQRQRLAEQQIAHLQREAESGGGGRTASTVAKELDAEQRLAVELESFRAEAERIANLGWEPDLDDGMVLNAAPLADLFPAWKDAASYRKELRAGKYEWATVAKYADQL